MNEITTLTAATSSEISLEEPPANLAGSLLNFVARAMADPNTNVDKLEALFRIQRQILADDARDRFNQAMSAVQAEMQPVLRDATNDQTNSKYARLETIDAVMRPIYARHGFSLSFNSEPTETGALRIVCEVAHSAGHTKLYHLEAALDTVGPQGKANKTPLHGLGSSVSYLRRYLTCMIFHVVLANEDNDGNRPRANGAPTGRTQTDELYALLAECSADPTAVAANERTFLTRMGLGDLRSLADVAPRDFARLKNALLTKKSIMAQRQAQNRRSA